MVYMQNPPYYLSVGAIFKNESDSIIEWLEHYIIRGVDHFYLIDDESTDSSVELLRPYIESGRLTLFQAKWGKYIGRQMAMYNEYILPRLNESKWLMIVDLDEYVWSPRNIDLKKVLHECEHLGQIQIRHTIYGSNGHIKQPGSIVSSFTRRSSQHPTENPGNYKYIVNSSFEFTSLNIHHATFLLKVNELNDFLCIEPDYFTMNHYCCQSKDFWMNVKCTRGDCDDYRDRKENDFSEVDLNDVEDLGLFNQYKLA